MASKNVAAVVKIQIPAGQASPAPPVGTALGPHGIAIMDFCKAYNAQTESQRGTVVPVEITISVGKARPLIRDLLKMGKNAVLPLDRRVDDAVELYVGERLIARGELEELDGDQKGQLAVRLTEVADLQEGL